MLILLFKYFCRVRYCVICIVVVATFLFIKLIIGIIFIVSRSIGCKALITRSDFFNSPFFATPCICMGFGSL